MKMKKYTAVTMTEAMSKVRADLGDDAVILNSKVVYTKGFLGLFKKKTIEVVAGMDKYETPLQPVQPLQKEMISSVKKEEVVSSELKKELSDIKMLVQSMQRPVETKKYTEDIESFLQYLRNHEINEELITRIGDELFEHVNEIDSNKQSLSYRQIATQVLKEALIDVPFGGLSYQKKYINVLGPTGVGKTTTIAKMAAHAVLQKKKKIGFITTDTYRIAAIEQLKTYAGLLQAPVEIVYNSEDFTKAMETYKDFDLVFIDTAGRNYKEVKFVEDVKKLIQFEDNVESYLVLSSTSKEKDMETIIEQFSSFPIEQFIFTKADETNSIGSMINLMIKYNKGLAYYTDGQEVPEDINEASVDSLLKLLFKEYEDERSS
ncbi:flagellar biosynthesis protein FlhF [Paenisporosarcina quisquiliarum]|uniref:flagellar biosynthesis protein FlhF n=1 Tax=Paenisporosarcina quisquiliarum TaxID=365346 RepID=UPI003735EAF9